MITEVFTRLRAFILVVLLYLSIAVLAPPPVQAAVLTLTPQQGVVGSEVKIMNITGYGIGEYQVLWGEDRQVIQQGNATGLATVVFAVPEATRGKHEVALKVGNTIFDGEFTVVPSLTLMTAEGYVGSNMTIKGSGFDANEKDIQILFGGSVVVRDVVADGRGNWQSTITVPPAASGSVDVDAGGATPSADVEDRSFTILPRIEINPFAGNVGTMVGVLGTGFGNAETGITIVFGGIHVKTGIAADSRGQWQSTFFVPTSPKGRHKVNSYGEVTRESAVPWVDFKVSPVLGLELSSGLLGDFVLVGDEFWIRGIGFEANEAGIQVTFDGGMIASGIVADAQGSWAAQVRVPTTSRGKHVIDASGNITRSEDVASSTLVVSPYIEINPATGSVGAEVVVKGNGFSANSMFTISYDGIQVFNGQTTDSKGSFTTGINVPPGKQGDHTVTVTDTAAAVASARFSTETTPPPTPNLVSPGSGSSLGFAGNAVVTFNWTVVEDPSSVSYTLEVSNNASFTSVVLRRENLSVAAYTLTREEALPGGDYYWRVKAIDGAGNEGEWTEGWFFQIANRMWVFPVALVVIILIGLVIWRVITLTRRGWK